MRSLAAAVLCASSFAGILSAEPVDFRKDVAPLIQKRCIACHGPEQQMNAFRLDRRSAALRGGTRSVIVPGNSAASRLYLRLIGDQFGRRMPATGPMPAEEIAVIKAWIDEGAPWPDELANEPVLTPPDPKAVRMVEALRGGDKAAFLKLVDEDPQALNLRGPDGSTPFMFAVLYSDAATVKALLAKGADPNKRNDANATALMWAVNDLEKTRALLDRGADVNALSSDGRTPLLIAATQAGTAPIVKLLLDHHADPNPKGRAPGDASPLREAAGAGDAEAMQLLLDHGANIKNAGGGAITGALEAKCSRCVDLVAKGLDAKEYTASLLSLSVYGDLDAMRFALDHGADVNAADVDGHTPLMFAANCDRLPLKSVALLIERGANVNAKSVDGHTALDAARLHGNSPIVDLLIKSGAKSTPEPTVALAFQKGNTIRDAVTRALPLLQKADLNFTQKSGCVSCHNEALTDMAISAARGSGFHIDEPLAKQEVKAVASFFGEWRERLLQGMAPGGPAYILEGLHAEQYRPDLITDSITHYIRMRQFPDGHWGVGCGGSRNPLCGDEITNTANSLRALQFYAPAGFRVDYEKSIQLASAWLAKASVYTHEDRTFRVFGLAWAGNKEALKIAVQDLLKEQHADGGWSDNSYLDSTSYATGQALVALHEAGIPLADTNWQRGIQFLLKTQNTDGSWYVKSRSFPAQPYFDDGFPHGIDQWISASGTNWAVIALSLASQGESNALTAAAR
jgi:ankyrin repeat protein